MLLPADGLWMSLPPCHDEQNGATLQGEADGVQRSLLFQSGAGKRARADELGVGGRQRGQR